MKKEMLESFREQRNSYTQNQLLFNWLRDDVDRVALYKELQKSKYPVLPFKSVLRSEQGSEPQPASDDWLVEDVYLVSKGSDVAAALQHYSVRPYATLDSGGRFMLGLDDESEHEKQQYVAHQALRFSPRRIETTVRKAVQRACVLPLKNHQFDLVQDIATQAGLRFVELLFGLPPEAHVELATAMGAAYTRLSFQIIGRHFVSDPGLPPSDPNRAQRLRENLARFIADAARSTNDTSLRKEKGLVEDTVIKRLHKKLPKTGDELVFIALGLMAGTIGNITAAISIAINDFFERGVIDEATDAARRAPIAEFDSLIDEALAARPPAPFLARTARGVSEPVRCDGKAIPEGAHVLLAIGADSSVNHRFGGAWRDAAYPHRCVGQHLAMPLIRETVKQVLLLPGLSRVIDPATGQPCPLEKRWGAMCMKFPLQFQRDRVLNQRSLHVVLPIKAPVAENARMLKMITEAGAYVVEDALRNSRHVHFAWFNLVDNDTHLAMSTVFDGDFDAYVEYFALDVPLFDKQFAYLDVVQPLPIRKHPKEFVANIRKYDRSPLGGYFFSAYPRTSVTDIKNAGIDRP